MVPGCNRRFENTPGQDVSLLLYIENKNSTMKYLPNLIVRVMPFRRFMNEAKFLCHNSKISFASRSFVAVATRTVNIAKKLY